MKKTKQTGSGKHQKKLQTKLQTKLSAALLAAALLLTACAGKTAGESPSQEQKEQTTKAQTLETQQEPAQTAAGSAEETAPQTEAGNKAASADGANQSAGTGMDMPADVHVIELSAGKTAGETGSVLLDGLAVKEYDYTLQIDPSGNYDEVKNWPAAHYTGTQPGDDGVYIAHDIVYYPEIETDRFSRVFYDDEYEWAAWYGSEENNEYIFGTLPILGKDIPVQMMHSAQEAYANPVLHITKAGDYCLKGTWQGQIRIDLGEDAFTNPEAVVRLWLDGADITCTVAPAIVFRNVYECDNAWEERKESTSLIDTQKAGARLYLADGSVNNISGTNVYRMLKTKYKNEDETPTTGVPRVQKKAWKTDGAVYSYMTMNIDGESGGTGVMNVTAGFEGVDTELHLSVNGGNVNIFSQDDGINVNEDGVSVVAVNGGILHIAAGLGSEGDGIDSNGYLVINGGTVIACANPASDSGLDSDMGSFVNGGTVLALGSTMDWAEENENGTSQQTVMNLRFNNFQDADEAVIVTDKDGKVLFAYDQEKDEALKGYARKYSGAIISAPALLKGTECLVYVGGNVDGTDSFGIYDINTVTGFSEEARQQGYAGTQESFGGHGGPGGPGGPGGQGRPQPPEWAEGQTPPEMPEGQTPPEWAEGQTPPEWAEGQTPPEWAEGQTPPEWAEGQTPPERPEDGRPGGMREIAIRPVREVDEDTALNAAQGQKGGPRLPQGQTPPEGGPGKGMPGQYAAPSETVFLLEKQVNCFYGVGDMTAG